MPASRFCVCISEPAAGGCRVGRAPQELEHCRSAGSFSGHVGRWLRGRHVALPSGACRHRTHAALRGQAARASSQFGFSALRRASLQQSCFQCHCAPTCLSAPAGSVPRRCIDMPEVTVPGIRVNMPEVTVPLPDIRTSYVTVPRLHVSTSGVTVTGPWVCLPGATVSQIYVGTDVPLSTRLPCTSTLCQPARCACTSGVWVSMPDVTVPQLWV